MLHLHSIRRRLSDDAYRNVSNHLTRHINLTTVSHSRRTPNNRINRAQRARSSSAQEATAPRNDEIRLIKLHVKSIKLNPASKQYIFAAVKFQSGLGPKC